MKKATIVGSGLTGCLMACYLARRGYRVDVFERRPDPRAEGAERGRSINLALSERGIDALRRIGLDAQVMAPALPMRGRMMHAVDGTLSFQQYAADGTRAINSISRSALNETLLDAAEAMDGVTIHFSHRLVSLDCLMGELTFEGPSGAVSHAADVVLGADGWRSAVRQSMQDSGLTSVRIDMLEDGYKELTIPPVDGDFAMDPQALHIWPRGRSMMIALPNPDRSFTCTLFWPLEGPDSFATVTTGADVAEHFARVYPDAVALIPDLERDYVANPLGQLGTVHTTPWTAHGRVALIGDAAHAILPFFGQGANCGFEDVVELDRCLDETGDAWPEALSLYASRRIDNAEAIALMAQENFAEMSDKVGSKAFLMTKKIEHALERALPGTYLSRYEMVSFTTIPYAEVIRRGRMQRRAVGVVAAGIAAVGGVVAVAAGRRSS